MGQELTAEQIQQAIAAKPELKTAVLSSLESDATEHLKGKGLIIRTKEEDTAFISNYEKNVLPGKLEEAIAPKIREVHDRYDTDLFEVLGERKAHNEKTYEFMKRKLAELKEKAGKGAGKDDPVLADQIKELQSKIKGYEGYVPPDEVNKLKTEHFKEIQNLKLSVALEKMPIAVPAHVTDEKQKSDFVQMQRDMISSNFNTRFTAKQNSEGKTVYYDGETLLTNEKDATPMTEAQIVEKYYSVYLQPANPGKAGAGSGAASTAQPDPSEASLKTKAEVDNYLVNTKKLTAGSPDFIKERTRILKDYGITK